MIDFHDKMMEEKELLGMSMKESIRQKEERTKIKIASWRSFRRVQPH